MDILAALGWALYILGALGMALASLFLVVRMLGRAVGYLVRGRVR